MKTATQYGGIDRFRVVAACLIVAIHTAPLSTYSASADFIFTHIFARIGVPFFFMATGFFLLPQYQNHEKKNYAPLKTFLRRTLALYGLSVLLYLPFNLYAGHFQLNSHFLLTLPKLLLFDGTFYHLWYLPATIIGVLLVVGLSKRLSIKAVFGISLLLYCVGLLGDSYYGVVETIPFLEQCYSVLFMVFDYTRNGLFFAPLYVCTGALVHSRQRKGRPSLYPLLMLISLGLMLAEGLLLQSQMPGRHDSMYIFLLPCSYFLFQTLLSIRLPSSKALRQLTSYVYILHPLCIISVRGFSKLVKLPVLVENSLIHFLLVCLLSFLTAGAVVLVLRRFSGKVFERGRAWIEIDFTMLRHNVQLLQAQLPEGEKLVAVLKADAYGHGATPLARELNALGIQAFATATVLEAVALRKKGVRGEILVLGYTHPDNFHLLRRYRLSQTVVDAHYGEELNRFGKKVDVHIKIDTGMHRLGERADNAEKILEIFQMENLVIRGMFTHLCVSDSRKESDIRFTRRQIAHFCHVAESVKTQGFSCPPLHIQSSYGLIHYPDLHCAYVRAGIALYGLVESTGGWAKDLRPILSLKARIETIRPVHSGEGVGYGLDYRADRETRLATVAIGYADGIPRSLSNGKGHVLVQGIPCPIVGRICMDRLTVDVTSVPKVQPGDEIVLIGTSGQEEITVPQIAEQAGTIPNEIVSGLGQRLPRIYNT